MSVVIVNKSREFACDVPFITTGVFSGNHTRNIMKIHITEPNVTYNELASLFVDGVQLQIKESHLVFDHSTGETMVDSEGHPVYTDEVYDYFTYSFAGDIIDKRDGTFEVHVAEMTDLAKAIASINTLLGKRSDEEITDKEVKDAREWIEYGAQFIPETRSKDSSISENNMFKSYVEAFSIIL